MSHRITLTGLRAEGHHGVLASERESGQIFIADVVLDLVPGAAATDELSSTVNYAEVAEAVVGILAGEPVDLIETLAERVATAVLQWPVVQATEVVVHKPRAPIAVEFADVSVAIRRERASQEFGRAERPRSGYSPAPEPVPIVLSLGANLGDARATLRDVVRELRHELGVHLSGVSPLARTKAVLSEDQEAQPDYLNAVVTGTTTLGPRTLLACLQQIEHAHGRRRAEHWGARTLDIDVVAMGEIEQGDPTLTLPHPRAHTRAFVLAPWARLDPEAVLPGPHGGPVAELAAAAPDHADLEWLAEEWA